MDRIVKYGDVYRVVYTGPKQTSNLDIKASFYTAEGYEFYKQIQMEEMQSIHISEHEHNFTKFLENRQFFHFTQRNYTPIKDILRMYYRYRKEDSRDYDFLNSRTREGRYGTGVYYCDFDTNILLKRSQELIVEVNKTYQKILIVLPEQLKKIYDFDFDMIGIERVLEGLNKNKKEDYGGRFE